MEGGQFDMKAFTLLSPTLPPNVLPSKTHWVMKRHSGCNNDYFARDLAPRGIVVWCVGEVGQHYFFQAPLCCNMVRTQVQGSVL